jgi:uncharacterized protein (DUF2384 family)
LIAPAPNVAVRKEATETFAPRHELERLVEAVGQAGASRLLGVGLPHVNKILSGKERTSSDLMRRILSVNYVLGFALQWFYADEIVGWLLAPEPLLGGRNPMGVLVQEGPQPVVEAIEGRIAGVYA